MLRWIFRVLLLIIDFLLLETGLVGIPNSIIGQIGYLNTVDDSVLLRILAIMLALIVTLLAIGPARLGEWRKIIAARGPVMGERRNNEESGGYVDNRSQSMSNSPGGQQAFGDIINQGPQPREISQSAGDALVQELRKHDTERFQISWTMNDAESGELGIRLQGLLEQSGWEMIMLIPGFSPSGGPPRGVIVETTENSEAINIFVSWLKKVNLNPQVNRGEQQFGNLAPPSDSPPAPVHIVVGVLPR